MALIKHHTPTADAKYGMCNKKCLIDGDESSRLAMSTPQSHSPLWWASAEGL